MLWCDKDVVRQNYSFLVKHIPTLRVLSHLYQVGVFTKKDCNSILKSTKQNRVLLYLLEKRGPHAFPEFLKSVGSHLVKKLTSLENKI